MNISSNLKPAQNSKAVAPAKGMDSVIRSIEGQIRTVENNLVKLSEDQKLSDKEKKEMRKNLKELLRGLNKELMNRKIELRNEELEKRKEAVESQSSQSIYVEDELVLDKEVETNLLSLSSSFKRLRDQNALSKNMRGQANILELEIEADEGRGFDASLKREELYEINSKIESINKDMATTLGLVKEELKKSSDRDDNKDKNDVENKDTSKKEKASINEKNKEIVEEKSNELKNQNETKEIDIHI